MQVAIADDSQQVAVGRNQQVPHAFAHHHFLDFREACFRRHRDCVARHHVAYAEATLRMKEETATGTQLQQSMRATDLFPNMVVQMVAIGEESGALDEMLGKVADFYEDEVDNLVDGLSSLLEPLIMAVLGVMVGGLVVAMYLPIFKLGAVI